MPQAQRWLIGVAAGLSNLGLYLAFTSNVGVREITAGVIVAGLATAAVIVFSTAAGVQFEFRLRDVMQAWRLPWAILGDTAKIMQALVMQLINRRGVPSVLATLVFDHDEKNPAMNAGCRALAITYNSAAPNSIMIGIVEDQGLMIYHQMIPSPPSPMVRNLGARP